MEIEDAAKEYAEINEDKAANSAHSYSKYDIADAYQQGYNLAVSRLKKRIMNEEQNLNIAESQQLNIADVSGSFSADEVERAYDDGYKTEGEVTFDIENYR